MVRILLLLNNPYFRVANISFDWKWNNWSKMKVTNDILRSYAAVDVDDVVIKQLEIR